MLTGFAAHQQSPGLSETGALWRKVASLSDRELAVFEVIGEGLTLGQIASRLDVSPRTVETHRKKIKSKLKLANSSQLFRLAVQWTSFPGDGHDGHKPDGAG
jgi:DNA-binding CsgD family transcriptional regulator